MKRFLLATATMALLFGGQALAQDDGEEGCHNWGGYINTHNRYRDDAGEAKWQTHLRVGGSVDLCEAMPGLSFHGAVQTGRNTNNSFYETWNFDNSDRHNSDNRNAQISTGYIQYQRGAFTGMVGNIANSAGSIGRTTDRYALGSISGARAYLDINENVRLSFTTANLATSMDSLDALDRELWGGHDYRELMGRFNFGGWSTEAGWEQIQGEADMGGYDWADSYAEGEEYFKGVIHRAFQALDHDFEFTAEGIYDKYNEALRSAVTLSLPLWNAANSPLLSLTVVDQPEDYGGLRQQFTDITNHGISGRYLIARVQGNFGEDKFVYGQVRYHPEEGQNRYDGGFGLNVSAHR